MDIMRFISQFLYRIRYWLLWGTIFVTSLVIYFTQFLPYSYTVKSSLYAGITTSTSLDGSAINFGVVTSTFDNLINIAKSRGTLEKVSIRLLANSLTYGEEWKDNQYIQAKHYRQLLQMAPKEVLALVDRKDVEKTLANLTAYRKESSNNFVYSIFNRPVAFYSAAALESINIKRAGNSDILEITYTSADPGITQKTVSILIDELIKAYEILRFKSTNDVIAYFQEQVRLAKIALNKEEDDLMNYNVQERVINYPEETKALAFTRYEVEDRLEEAERIYQGAVALRDMLDERMDVRAQIIRSNTNLLQELNKVSTLNQSIMEQEIFTTDKHQQTDSKLRKEKEALKKAIENFDLPKNYQPDILVWKLIKRYYNQKAGAGMEAVLNIKRGIHNVALAASKLNELLNDKLSDGASLEDVPVVIGYMKQINDLANQFPNTIKALNVAEENLLYEQENVAGRGGVEITSSMIEE